MRHIVFFTILSIFLSTSSVGYCQNEVLIINTSYSPPYSTPEESGILDRLLIEAASRIGVVAKVEMLPAERCLRDANSGAADGDTARVWDGITTIYPNLIRVDEAIIEKRDFVVFSRTESFNSTGWESLRPYHVASVKGWKIFDRNMEGAKSHLHANSTMALFKMLKNDRVDIVLNARRDGLMMAAQLDIVDIKVMEPPLASLKLYPYLNKKWSHLSPLLANAIRDMKEDGTFDKIVSEAMEN